MKLTSLKSTTRFAGAAVAFATSLSFAASLAGESPVAIVNGKPILESELGATSQAQLMNLRKQEYDIKRRALDAAIDQRLLEAEARRRGVSVSDLTQKETDKSIAEPTDAEVEAYFLARQDLANRRFDDVREQMRTALKLARRTAALDSLMSRLRARYPVEVLLDAPRVEVAIDAARLTGARDAPVRIVEFSDFECPYCRSVEKTLQALLVKYDGKVSLAYRDFPLSSIHPGAQRAAEASRCAAEQGKFWPFHDRLLVSSSLDAGALKDHARELGLDQKRFDACVDGGVKRAAVESDAEQGRRAGVVATPSFFINGIPINGALPAAAFEKIIEEELARKSVKTAAR